MDRRKFVKNIGATAGGALLLNNIPVRLMARSATMQKMMAECEDKVLILVQLHGGNDGLNTLIPLDQYSLYQNLRPNLALPKNGFNRVVTNLDSTLPASQHVGIHPDMGAFKQMYDEGLAAVVHNVGYEGMNQSHFRGQDIWLMGGGNDDFFDSGWVGRYLNHRYPGYPEGYPSADMPDPLGLEIGENVSLAFHTGVDIPASLSVQNPQQFHELIEKTVGLIDVPQTTPGAKALPTESLMGSCYANELDYISSFEQQADLYSERLYEVYQAGRNSNINYPEVYPFSAPAGRLGNPLSGQLRLIARLLSGGIQTKMFLTKIGGFDTHASQVEAFDTTMGNHSALLYHTFGAIKAFMDDIKLLGLQDKVAVMTFSEFGRRVASNGSFGTDHGSAAPVFLFGKNITPGIIGNAPDLEKAENGNIKMEIDYRRIIKAVMEDHVICPDYRESTMDAIGLDPEASSPKLPLFDDGVIAVDDQFFNDRYHLKGNYPNPVQDKTRIEFRINDSLPVKISLYNQKGKHVKNLMDSSFSAGEHSFNVDLSDLLPGVYIYQITAGPLKQSKKLVKD